MNHEIKFWVDLIAGLLWLALLVYLTVKVPRWLKLSTGNGWLLRLVLLPLMLVGSFRFALWAFGPSEALRAQRAEERRLYCLDKFDTVYCPGEVEPPNPDHMRFVLQKLNGRWFIGPREYFNGFNAATFYWPSKTPMSGWPDPATGWPSGKAYPESDQDFSEKAIEIFLWSSPANKNPDFGMKYLQRMEAQGRVVSKETIKPGLQAWIVNDEHDPIARIRYVATDFVQKAPNGAYLSCQGTNPETHPETATCTTGDVLIPGISWDTRFSGKHAQDWPQIYSEIIRVLSLLKETQP